MDEPEQLTSDTLAKLDPRYLFVPHWSHRIPAEIYEQWETVLFHETDLPYGRGGSPIQNLIARGFQDTTVTALRCSAELDAGPVYLKRRLSLLGDAEEVFLRAAAIVKEMIETIVREEPVPAQQRGEPVTFPRRSAEESSMHTCRTLDEVFDHIRMLDAEGYPPAFLDAGPFRLHFARAARRDGRVIADVTVTDRDD